MRWNLCPLGALTLTLSLAVTGAGGCTSEPLPETRPDGAERVTAGLGSEQNPCLSPDGRSLLFTRFSRGYNEGPAALVLLDLESGDEEVLLDDDDHDHVNLPGRCFSADGAWLTFSADTTDRDEIWVMELATRATTRLTDHPGLQAFEPAFSFDGGRITFELVGDGRNGAIHSVTPEGGDEQALTDGGSDDRQPSPSPVDERVLFQSTRGGTWGLWTVPIAGGEPSVLFDTAAEETDASWSPDGSTVVLATDDCGALSCAATYQGGALEVRQTPAGWYEGAPALSDDGTIYVEAADDDPEDRGRTTIYRLP